MATEQPITFDIGLDVDDVLFPWSTRAHAACENAGITNGRSVTQWAAHLDYGCTREEFWAAVMGAYDDGMLLEAPYDYVLRELTLLTMFGHRIHLVTARGFEGVRSQEIRQWTREWVLKYNLPVSSLSFLQDKTKFTGLDYFLDDNWGHVKAFRAVGVEAYLHDQGHNLALTEATPRVPNLCAFVELVLGEAHVMTDDNVCK